MQNIGGGYLTHKSPDTFAKRGLHFLALATIVLAGGLGLYSIAKATFAKYTLSKDTSQYAVISNRPKEEDVNIILGSEGSSGVLYFRPQEDFAKSLLAAPIPRDGSFENSPLRIVKFVDRKATRELDPEAGAAAVESYLNREQDAKQLPLPAIGGLVGIAIGLAFALAKSWRLPLLGALAATSVVKLVTACPVCPNVTIAGIDAALIGAASFLLLALGSVVLKGKAALGHGILLPIFASSVLVWQTVTWWSTKLQCVPCTIVAGLCGLLAVSSLRWPAAPPESIPSKGSHIFAWTACAALIVGLWIRQAPEGGVRLPSADTPQALTSLGMPKKFSATNITELGLKPAKPQILLVGAKGCHACDDAVKALDAAGIQRITYAYIGFEQPDTKREWLKIPKDGVVSATPTIIFADSKGNITNSRQGLDWSPAGLKRFSEEVTRFFTDPTK